VNPFYLHYALRLPSTLEQFRKWSTGSSYPAILDGDVKKTLIPIPDPELQDAIAAKVVAALRERAKVLRAANAVWVKTLDGITASLCGKEPNGAPQVVEDELDAFSIAEVQAKLEALPPITTDQEANGEAEPEQDDDLAQEATELVANGS
jgi:type I restriction enzyme S subunit